MRYLYGSNVVRIQPFIFETGKLKEIIGASEIVQQICTERFKNAVGQGFKDENLIVGAAGKTTYIFDSREECQKVVYDFHKKILEEVPGIKLTQAVVEIEGNIDNKHFRVLEQYLEIQKNLVSSHYGMGLMVTERSRRTGNPAIDSEKDDDETIYIDRNQVAKRNQSPLAGQGLLDSIIGDYILGKNIEPLVDLKNLLKDEENGWIAIIHADGNSLGKTIQLIKEQVAKDNPDKLQEILKSFSEGLHASTKSAVYKAFEDVIKPTLEEEIKINNGKPVFIPFRPVVLGGDDLTLIIRGDLAIYFTEVFLKYFDFYTKNNFSHFVEKYNINHLIDGLSACAGIAFIKSNYPIHYGVDLAEALCKSAKNVAKSLDSSSSPSCLSFHRVQSSFIEKDFDPTTAAELIAQDEMSNDDELIDGNERNSVSFNYGPYFLKEQNGYPTISQLQKWVKYINTDKAPKAPLREWLEELNNSSHKAQQKMDRIMEINQKYISKLDLNKALSKRVMNGELKTVTHIFDIITLSNIEN